MLNNLNSNKKPVIVEVCRPSNYEQIPLNKITKGKNMININKANGNKKIRGRFKLNDNGKETHFGLSGQQAKSLNALIQAKEKGITALEVSCWAYRLAAYIHILRTEYNLDISTRREAHEGGHHGRYFLHSKVEILGIINPFEEGVKND